MVVCANRDRGPLADAIPQCKAPSRRGTFQPPDVSSGRPGAFCIGEETEMKTMILLCSLMCQQDVARPVPLDVLRQATEVYLPVPLVRLNGLLPAPGMVWVKIYIQHGENL